jgi:hypothetical protein
MAHFYQYAPLESTRSFRLVRLVREPDRSTDDIEVEIEVVDMIESPDYNALSYAWDADSPDSEVLCQGFMVPITRNCKSALQKIRDGPRKLWELPLYVDAICINQSSTNERNHQVRLMGQLYSNAQTVLCWFGDVHCGRKFHFLHYLVANYADKAYKPNVLKGWYFGNCYKEEY